MSFIISLFCYVENTEASFLFHQNTNFRLIKKKENSTKINSIKEVKVKNGTVMMFNGNVSHSVTPNQTDNERITLAMNFNVAYDSKRVSY